MDSKVIYKTTGRAKEYNDYACNLFFGCSHGCVYCYGPDVLHRDRIEFHNNPVPRKNILDSLRAHAGALTKLRKIEGNILLCFVTDPYQPADVMGEFTREAIKILHSKGLGVTILTKGGWRAARDFDILQPGDEFAVTLTCGKEETSLKWEPGAAIPEERIDVLKGAHDMGIKTWVSFEPVLFPGATLKLMERVREFADEYRIGKLNYHPHAKEIDWKLFGQKAIECCQNLDIDYMIKADLAQYLGREETIIKRRGL
jgi:DNA repair photolyase